MKFRNHETGEVLRYRDIIPVPYKTRVLAIDHVAKMETHNSVTKAELVAALRWLFAHYDFEED